MRRLYISTICIAVAFVLAASCNKVEVNPIASEENGRTVFTAMAEAIGGGTKAQNQYCYSVLWEKNDQIYVTDGKKANTFTVSDESVGTNKGKFTEDTPSYGITGNIEAFYPASLKTGGGYVWPAVQANNQAAPMYARQTISGTGSEIVNFSSLGAMLQIVFNSTVEGITLKSIELKDAQKDLSGTFTVDESGRAVISSTDGKGVTLDLGEGKALGKGANFFYLSIPAGIYNDLTISFYTTDRRVCTMHSTTFPEVKRNTVCRLTLTGTNFKERHLSGPGLFSVGDGRVIKFAKGNLYWNGDSFEFEENQLGYPTILSPSHIGHFFWSKDASVARAVTFDSSGSGEHDVLFTNATEPTPNPEFTVSGVTGEFRTLSELEWKYLLGNHEHKWVTICETTGIAIVPDDFAGSLANTYDATAWAVAEADGVVFLPSASYRSNGSIEGGEINGKYWSSAPYYADRAQSVIWYESTKYCSCSNLLRSWGSSVRLVEDTKYAKSVSMDKTALTLYASQSAQLNATILPADAPDKSVVWTSDDTDVAAVDENGKVSAVSPGKATITVTTVDRGRTASCTVTVEPLISGEFTINESGAKVHFAKGNLYWDGDSFEFEENQLGYPVTLSLSHIGHFFWSKDASVARAETFDLSGRGEHDVLFTNATEPTPNPDFTVSGVTGEFRALSGLEWKYLLDNHGQKWVTIDGKTGIAIVPDGFAGSLASTYDATAWAAAEADGVVFLPAASYRSNGGIEGGEINGEYWSSAPWTSYRAQAIIWYESTKYCSCSDLLRSWGSSIRLVKDIKP